jgi:hypothetical protein
MGVKNDTKERKMLNLYWKSDNQTRTLRKKPFVSEAEFEQYIFDNQDILGGDIYILHRQIRTGSKQGILDMLGVDKDNRVCVIELKNEEANEDILPQALGYAIWAETHPDSIRAIWLESEQRPEDIEIEWDKLGIRVILIAPSFKSTVPPMASKIGYSPDLLQIRRYCFEEEEFLLVEKVEWSKPEVGVPGVKGDWDWGFYESEHGKEATAQFRQAVEAVAALVERQGWDISYKLNKYYTGFMQGRTRLVFSVNWGGTYAWKLTFKLPEDVAEGFKGRHWEFQRYDNTFHEAIFRPLQPDSPDIEELEQFFVQAYKYISGTK